jgi:hypothetical protein
MPFLRNVLKDLVDKRLWPVAALLVAALVAVPVVLGRSGDDAATTASLPATGAAVGTGTNEKASVTLETTPDDTRHDGGSLRDPFHAPKLTLKKVTDASPAAAAEATGAATAAVPATTGSSATPAATGGSSVTTTTGSSGSSSDSSTGDSAPTTKPAKSTKTITSAPVAEDKKDTYHVSVRFGTDDEHLTTKRDIARLSPLPSATDPFFVYLGVLEATKAKEKRAVFIVSSDADPLGEGACHPTAQDCQSVELTVGQTAYFNSTAPNGVVSQYVLQLAGIHKTEIASEAKASAAIARHSVTGTELLRDAATRNVRFAAGARAYRYVPARGLLQRAKRRHITAKAAAAGAIPGIELVDAKDQPGLPVWRSPENDK